MIMWVEERKTGFKFVERYTDPMTGKTRRISVVMEKNTAQSRKLAAVALSEKIDKALKGESDPDKLELLEKSYYDACSSYISNTGKNYIESSTQGSDDTLERKNATSTQWAAYVSRITACRLLSEGNIRVVDSMYFKTR